jgi:hypothetical protein
MPTPARRQAPPAAYETLESAAPVRGERDSPGEPVVTIVEEDGPQPDPALPTRARPASFRRAPGHASPAPAPHAHVAPAPPPSPGECLGCDEPPAPPEQPHRHEANLPHHGPPGYRFYGQADYLHWWLRKRTSPVLLATGPAGTAATTALNDGLDFDNQERRGARGTFGFWLTPRQAVGLELTGLWLAERSPDFATSAAALNRPFLDARSGLPATVVLAAPGVQTGAASLEAPSRLWGGESNLRLEVLRAPWGHVDLLAGFRYLRIEDDLAIFDSTTFAPGLAGLSGLRLFTSDSFATRNQFWGGQLGAEAEVHWGPLFVNLWGKVALGSLDQVVNISGETVVINALGTRAALPGGTLALASNSGRFERSEFSYVPEVGINLGYQLTPHLRVRAGYTLLYVGNVVRAGDQIDTTINPTQRPSIVGRPPVLVGPVRPLFLFRDVDFWAQGANVGLEFRF